MALDIPTLPADAPTLELVTALEKCGAVIVKNFLTHEITRTLNAEFDRLSEAEACREQGYVNPIIADFFGDNVSHLAGLAGKSPAFIEHVLLHPLYAAFCEAVLKPNCSDYQLNIAHLMTREPGCDAQLIHRDAWVWKRLPPLSGEVQLASVIALVDFTAGNGATLVAPGSHRWDDDRYPEMDEMVPAEMQAGSAIIYSGNTFHAGGANTSAQSSRRGMHVSYCLGWLRTEENQVLAMPWSIAEKLSPRAQQLLGFGVHDDIAQGGGYLGTVELEAPVRALTRGLPAA